MPFDSYSGEKFKGDIEQASLPTNHYEVLGVSQDATVEEIKKAYRKQLIDGLHEDKIIAMEEGDEKRIAEAKLEALKESLKVLTNDRLRASYDIELRNPNANQFDYSSKKEPTSDISPEKIKEWYDLARLSLDFAQDKDQMMAAIKEFNSHFKGMIDQNDRMELRRDFIVSIPEGDFIIMKSKRFGSVNECEGIFPMELKPFMIGEKVKVERSDGSLESDWEISKFELATKSDGSAERIVVVSKTINGEKYEKRPNSKILRNWNL